MANLFMHAEISTVASQQVGFIGFSMWGLFYLPAFRWVLPRYSGISPQSNDMHLQWDPSSHPNIANGLKIITIKLVMESFV